jgi:trehalose utilization protein
VLKGMGLIVLHSGHHSKLFRRLMGTNCNLVWRELPEGDLERVWVIRPSHPIAEGLPPYFEVPQPEIYGEPFDSPTPEELIFLSGSKEERYSAAAARFSVAVAAFSSLDPDMKPFRSITTPMSHRVFANAIR